ncbi:MAG: TlpA disulfide reductase family protein [Capsulimonadaceae bacterium]|nr:TlpA disulfide reductase family protein [Capsulimonadaceae bacterium]
MYWNNPKLLVVIVVLIGVIAFIRLTSQPAGLAATDDDSSTPFHVVSAEHQILLPDFTLTPAEGQPFKLSAAVAKGPVVLDFWATYCGPCRMELPELDKIRTSYASKGVQFYAINASDTPDIIRQYATVTKLGIPMLVDRDAEITRYLSIDSIPFTIVIDSNRKIVSGLSGFDEDMSDHLPVALDKILGSKT